MHGLAAQPVQFCANAKRHCSPNKPQEALVAYCRAALRLGVLQALGPLAVAEVQQLVMRDLTADDFTWWAFAS